MRWRRRDQPVSEEVVRSHQRERLEVLAALVRAQERRAEVLAAVAAAPTDEAAQDALAQLLGLSGPVQALAVLDLQLRRMTVENRERLRAEYDELRAAVGDVG